jgi:2-haloacid dehalogenase
MPERSVVVFDLGGVLIDWDPRYFYRTMFNGDEAAMGRFLTEVCNPEWNTQQDAGRPFAEACALLSAQYPDHAKFIDAWMPGYPQMMAGTIPGSVEVLAELRERGVPLYAITNWSAETYPIALERFEFLQWFRGVVVSGEVKLLKPDPRIFKVLFERFNIDPAHAVYVDDIQRNVDAATKLGMHGVRFTTAADLRSELTQLGLLQSAGAEPAGAPAIRRAEPQDAKAIARVLQQSFVEYESLYTPEGFAATALTPQKVQERLQEGPAWVVVLTNGTVVATASAVEKSQGLYIRGMAVAPAARGARIGEKLLEELERFARESGAQRMFLSTTPFLDRAISLYKRFGFRITDDPPHSLLGTPLLTMVKDLIGKP